MGSVYEAIDEETHDRVALKVLSRCVKSEHLRRFRREAQLAMSVMHPNLCRIFTSGSNHDQPFIVMERLRGETLGKRISRLGPLKPATAITITVQCLNALAAVHAAHVLHRDVKPDNIFLTTSDDEPPFAKLLDFGLARGLATSDTEVTTITSVGAVPGTPAYLTPEQIRGGMDLDERVDVWGAGLTLYEMLTGKRAFVGRTLEELMGRIIEGPLPCARAAQQDVPPGVDAVLAKALAKSRSDRWPSAVAFRDALIEAWAAHRASAIRRSAQRLAGGGGASPPSSSSSRSR